MAVSQALIYLDKTGNIRCEMPASNGARRKVDLPPTFAKRNPELLSLLRDDLARIKADQAKIAELKAAEVTKRQIDAESEIQASNDRFVAQARKRQAWLDSLPRDQRENELRKIDAKLERAAEMSNARARSLYYYIVENHTLKLAERVIDEPSRRPRRKLLVMTNTGMREISPRTGATKSGLTSADMLKAIDL